MLTDTQLDLFGSPTFPPATVEMLRGAVISPCGLYRYRLTRQWGNGEQTVAFVMLNPSTADADTDDPTLRRCIGFAKAWGFGSLRVVNLFAYRATDPRQMRKAADPVGRDNPMHLDEALRDCQRIVAAWGNDGLYRDRGDMFTFSFYKARRDDLLCFGTTNLGQPKHPLYLPANASLIPLRRSR